MSQQHDERLQDRFEAYEANEYRLASGQSQFSVPRSGIFIDLRFALALLSVITLLTMSVVNMVIERLLETVLYGLGPYFPGVLRLLFFTLPPLGMAILLTGLLVWINRFVGRWARNISPRPLGEKLLVSQRPSIGQRLGLAFISVGLVVPLWLTVTFYLRFGPYLSDALFESTIARLAAIPIFTAALLAGAAIWINIIFSRKQP